MKKCKDCKKIKEEKDFYTRQGECKDCSNFRVRENRKKKKAYYDTYDQKRNRESYRLIASRRYSSMLERVEGRGTRPYKVEGTSICTKKEFMEWAMQPDIKRVFVKLQKQWKEAGYPRRLAPSIDRIDNAKGYIITNIQWLPLYLNIKKDRDLNSWKKRERNDKGQFKGIKK